MSTMNKSKLKSKSIESNKSIESHLKLNNSNLLKNIDRLSLLLCKRMEKELKDKRFGVKQILSFIGAGVLSLSELYPSNIRKYALPYLRDPEANTIWEQFNIPYLKRQLKRLEKQKLITIEEKEGKQTVAINNKGRFKILKYAINDLKIKRPTIWDGKWWIVCYDLPKEKEAYRHAVQHYFISMGFFPLQKSVYLHAYPCKEETTFLREYFGLGEYIRIFRVDEIENSDAFKKYFGL